MSDLNSSSNSRSQSYIQSIIQVIHFRCFESLNNRCQAVADLLNSTERRVQQSLNQYLRNQRRRQLKFWKIKNLWKFFIYLFQGGKRTWNFWKPRKIKEFCGTWKNQRKVREFREIRKCQGILTRNWEKLGNFTWAKRISPEFFSRFIQVVNKN